MVRGLVDEEDAYGVDEGSGKQSGLSLAVLLRKRE